MQETLTTQNRRLLPCQPAVQQAGQQQVASAALARLAKSSVAELRSLRVDGSENKLQLSGQVRSFYHKQLAQETVRSVAAGMQVVNDVAVSPVG